ncbi:MAG: CorA family divalent cation transporter, partial [Polyangiales bacterium]
LPNARSDGFHATEIQSPLGLLDTGAASTERLARRLDDRMENLVRRKQDYKQVLLNRRIAMLTILSAIFMPLTLLTGIWGMNFEHMPELDNPYAYPAALGLMATLGLGGAWAFYKRGWFG